VEWLLEVRTVDALSIRSSAHLVPIGAMMYNPGLCTVDARRTRPEYEVVRVRAKL
jgi:hypothetical protein